MMKHQIVPQKLTHVRFHGAFSLFVGRGRRWSCAAVAEASGIPKRTIESYASGDNLPNLAKYQSLCSVLGQAFFAATVEHLPFEIRSNEPGDIEPSELLTEILSFASHLSRMLEDHRLDHREEAELKRILPVLRERITQAENALKTGEA